MGNDAPSVVFINPPGPARLYRSMVCTFVSKANYIWQPQDFINLSAQVPPGHDLEFIDCCRDRITEEGLFLKIQSRHPALCVIALTSLLFDLDLAFLKRFKKQFPEIRCLVLGDVLLERAFWKGVLEYSDGILLNSLDIDLKYYIETNRANSENFMLKEDTPDAKMTSSEIPKEVCIGVPRHEIFINKKYRFPFVKSYVYATVTSQFGCPFHCWYCSQSKIPVTYRRHHEVVDEIAKIKGLGIRDIFFGDPSFGFPRDNAVQILQGMIKRDLKMRWSCYANPALLDKDLLELMKRAGCHTLIIGIDDVDFEMLKVKYQRNLSRGCLIDFCAQCHDLKMKVCADFIIGINDDERAIDNMVLIAKQLKMDYASFNIYTILFGSRLRENLIKEGRLDPRNIGGDTSGNIGYKDEKLIKLRNLAVKKFYLRPAYLYQRLTSITTIPEFMIQVEEMVAMFKNIISAR
jgi:anaerobic magnesium-protoporphyrin IX monomethyl ester cyclase